MKKKQQYQINSDNIIYGFRPIEEILKDVSQISSIEKIFVDEKKHRVYQELLNYAREHKIVVQYVPEIKLEKLAKGKNHQGIVAHILKIQYQNTLDILKDESVQLIVFLDRITDVRNFGSIARSAYAMGVDAILIPTYHSASINSDAIKTSAGALLKIPVCKEQKPIDVLKILKDKGFQIVACHEKTSQQISDIDWSIPSVIILGSEHNGILKEYLKLCDAEARIPMARTFDSLNVSVSAGIIFYEVYKQRIQS